MKTLERKSANGVNGNGNGSFAGHREANGNGARLPLGSALKIERSIAYMMQHIDQPLHIARLAAEVNVSPSHYFALFKRNTGCAPIDFFIRLRMRHACELLESTSLSVKEIAAELGYDDPFYFSRSFKSVNRVAPSEYRTIPRELKNKLKPAGLPGNVSEPINHQSVTQQNNHWDRLGDAGQLKAQIHADNLPKTIMSTLT